ncbi:MAG: O-methyltransferase [Nitrospirota bacterium]|jgi:caffeoyl-CoA O-methyltransferase
MSANSTLVTADHFAYLASRTAGDDAFLRELKAAAEAAGFPTIWIAPEQASFMQILLAAMGAREVVEVGTLAGVSAIAMARALPPDGRVRTIEVSRVRADFATEWIARSDVADRVTVVHGNARELLPTFASGSADAAFLDADKGAYPDYLEECLRIVRPGGVIMADNAFAFGELFAAQARDSEVAAIRHFNDVMAAEPRLQSVIVPLGDGLWVAVKR